MTQTAGAILKGLLRGAEEGRWLDYAGSLKTAAAGGARMSRDDIKGIVVATTDLMGTSEPHRAAHVLFAGLVLDEAQTLAELRRAASFRLSRRRFMGGAVSVTARELCDASDRLGPETGQYLLSIVNLDRVAKGARAKYRALLQWLTKERERGLKGAAATLDWLFLCREYSPHGVPVPWGFVGGPQYGIEHLADGFASSSLALIRKAPAAKGGARQKVPVRSHIA